MIVHHGYDLLRTPVEMVNFCTVSLVFHSVVEVAPETQSAEVYRRVVELSGDGKYYHCCHDGTAGNYHDHDGHHDHDHEDGKVCGCVKKEE